MRLQGLAVLLRGFQQLLCQILGAGCEAFLRGNVFLRRTFVSFLGICAYPLPQAWPRLRMIQVRPGFGGITLFPPGRTW